MNDFLIVHLVGKAIVLDFMFLVSFTEMLVFLLNNVSEFNITLVYDFRKLQLSYGIYKKQIDDNDLIFTTYK